MPSRLEPAPVLRVCSCLTASRRLLPAVERELARHLGPLAAKSSAFPFDTSEYYREEMGPDLERFWYCFGRLFGAEQLADTRCLTERIEAAFARRGRRRVNLDPGYLDLGKLVLASTKPAPDKIYLGGGVWAHTCLRFRGGAFEAPDHSFPDFRDGRFNEFMREARTLYKSLLASSDDAAAKREAQGPTG